MGVTPGTTGAFAIPPGAVQVGQAAAFQVSFANAYEEFYSRFNVEAAKRGFTLQERIVPPNAMTAPFQTVLRWRRPETAGLFFQLGMGVFTINGSPPSYSHWDEFVPTVRDGIEGLLAALDSYPGGRPQSFNQTHLRYIDLFDEKLAKGHLALSFFSEIMGLNIGIPRIIEEISNNPKLITPFLNLSIPIDGGITQLVFGNGVVGGKQGFILDSTVTRTTEIEPSIEASVKALTDSHAITNQIFMALTKPLHETMEPLK